MYATSYLFLKHATLNEKEKFRLRVKAKTEKCLMEGSLSNDTNKLVNDLFAFYGGNETDMNTKLINWILCYGGSRLIEQLIQRRKLTGLQTQLHRAINQADLVHVLPREHIEPEVQKVCVSPSSKHALICFTGLSHRLNIPVQLFHFMAAKHFDLILYLRDVKKKQFVEGIPGVASNIEALSGYLRNQIPPHCHVAALGTSGGGYAAARLAEYMKIDKLALFSPPITLNQKHSVSEPTRHTMDSMRLFFANNSQMDCFLAGQWAYRGYQSVLRLLTTQSHGTLSYIFQKEKMNHLFHWLKGESNEEIIESSSFVDALS